MKIAGSVPILSYTNMLFFDRVVRIYEDIFPELPSAASDRLKSHENRTSYRSNGLYSHNFNRYSLEFLTYWSDLCKLLLEEQSDQGLHCLPFGQTGTA